MNSAWFRGLNEQERVKMKETLENSHFLLDKLFEICYNIGIELEEISIGDYDNSSWSHKQAHRNGELEMLRKIKKILELK